MQYVIEICLDEENELYQRLAVTYASQNPSWIYEGGILRNLLTGGMESVKAQINGALTGLAFTQKTVEENLKEEFPLIGRIGEIRVNGQTICAIGDKFSPIE